MTKTLPRRLPYAFTRPPRSGAGTRRQGRERLESPLRAKAQVPYDRREIGVRVRELKSSGHRGAAGA